jgi:hypothetical protein
MKSTEFYIRFLSSHGSEVISGGVLVCDPVSAYR